MTYHYHSIDDDRDNASRGVMTLYDAHFRVVGMWSKQAGRAMLGDAFYVREDANTGREGERNNERDSDERREVAERLRKCGALEVES